MSPVRKERHTPLRYQDRSNLDSYMLALRRAVRPHDLQQRLKYPCHERHYSASTPAKTASARILALVAFTLHTDCCGSWCFPSSSKNSAFRPELDPTREATSDLARPHSVMSPLVHVIYVHHYRFAISPHKLSQPFPIYQPPQSGCRGSPIPGRDLPTEHLERCDVC